MMRNLDLKLYRNYRKSDKDFKVTRPIRIVSSKKAYRMRREISRTFVAIIKNILSSSFFLEKPDERKKM